MKCCGMILIHSCWQRKDTEGGSPMRIGRRLGKFVQKTSVGLRLRHSILVHTRTKGSKDLVRKVNFTYIPVHLHDIKGQRRLVVVHMGGRKRMMLLTWQVPKSSVEAAQWIRAYLRRWSVKDWARACKQLVSIPQWGKGGLRPKTAQKRPKQRLYTRKRQL